MTKFRISTSKENLDTSVEVAVLFQQENITVEGSKNNVQWKNKQGDQFVLIGEVVESPQREKKNRHRKYRFFTFRKTRSK